MTANIWAWKGFENQPEKVVNRVLFHQNAKGRGENRRDGRGSSRRDYHRSILIFDFDYVIS